MNYSQLFTDHHVATLQDWLMENGQLFIHFEFPHSGGSGFSYSVSSLEQLKSLVSKQSHDEIEIFIFKGKPLNDEELDKRLERQWLYQNVSEALYIAVLKNCNYHEGYEKSPEKYKDAVVAWFE